VNHIYLAGAGGRLVRMSEQPFEAEADLETLLAEHPELITDDLGDGGRRPRWLLVSRQARVDADGSTKRWAVDILFIDEDAIPALVEVKRSSNTELRRGAVAQILDYAAHAAQHWSAESLQANFAATWRGRNRDPNEVLDEFLAGTELTEGFWQRAHTNLRAGRIRLVFAADEVPTGLRRVVGFLSRQMRAASVFAVEVKRFGADEVGR